MKKLTALLLSIVLLCGALVGCNQEDIPEDESKENGKESETTQKQNVGLVEGILDDYDKEESQKGFTIKGKKYPYNENDVLILEVENTTETHYSTTFIVTFYDEAGEIVKTQKKSLEQFPAEYKQACVFQPECQFDNYTCELSVKEYTGTDYLSTLLCGKHTSEVKRFPNKLQPNGERRTYIIIRIQGSFGPCTVLPEETTLRIRCDVVVFDNTGEIYTIYSRAPLHLKNTDTTMVETNDINIISSTDLDIQIPEELKGEVTIILAPVGFDLYSNNF